MTQTHSYSLPLQVTLLKSFLSAESVPSPFEHCRHRALSTGPAATMQWGKESSKDWNLYLISLLVCFPYYTPALLSGASGACPITSWCDKALGKEETVR